MQRDDSTFQQKVKLRREALCCVKSPIVMETHGGTGRLYHACYRSLAPGIVFEKDERKVELLARQRPTWAVYQADCAAAIRAGVTSYWPINFVDIDPHGEPWSAIDAVLESEISAAVLIFVVTDGLRSSIKAGRSWSIGNLKGVVQRFGNDLHGKYLTVCELLMTEKSARAGYRLSRFDGYYCGHANQMTHYLAVLDR